MNPLVALASSWLPTGGWERLAVDALWQSTLLAGGGLLLARLASRRAAMRGAILLATAILAASVPLLSSAVRATGGGWLPAPQAASRVAAQSRLVDPIELASPAPVRVATPVAAVNVATPPRSLWPLLAWGWLALSLQLAWRLTRGWLCLRGAIRSAEPCSDPAIRAALSRASQALAVRPPAVLTSPVFETPALAGLWRPRLLVPVEMPKGTDWFTVFCHELAHLARRDGARRLSVELCLVVLPWQPLLWIVRREFRSACEEACDDWAVSCGANPIDLASLLVELVPQIQPSLALGMAESPAATKRRVLRLLDMKGAVRPQLGLALGILGWMLAVGLGVALAILQPGRPQPVAPGPTVIRVPAPINDGSDNSVPGVFYNYSTTAAGSAPSQGFTTTAYSTSPPWGNEPIDEAIAKAAAALPKAGSQPAPYVIEIPDVLIIDAVKLVPKAPYHIEPLDVLVVQVSNPLIDQPIAGNYSVDPSGKIDLGAAYGKVMVAGQTVEEVQETVIKHLSNILRDPSVSVTLGQSSGAQQIAGEHLVGPDGTVNLGTYGTVFVAGMTIAEAKKAVESRLSEFLEQPRVSVEVFAYNSKVYYLVVQGPGGDAATRCPVTGNETVLDALAQASGKLPNFGECWIWVARTGGHVLPVDWQKMVEGSDGTSNWHIVPGDRVFVRSKFASPAAGAPSPGVQETAPRVAPPAAGAKKRTAPPKAQVKRQTYETGPKRPTVSPYLELPLEASPAASAAPVATYIYTTPFQTNPLKQGNVSPRQGTVNQKQRAAARKQNAFAKPKQRVTTREQNTEMMTEFGDISPEDLFPDEEPAELPSPVDAAEPDSAP